MPPNPTREFSPLFLRRSALAAVGLLLVAGLHLYRVVNFNQSRWKGGGFGMFSTVDAETARFLRIYLVTEAGVEIPVRVPESLTKRAMVLRALPQKSLAEELADRLLALRWRSAEQQATEQAVQLARLPADRPVTTADLEFATETVAELKPGERSTWEPVAKKSSDQGIRPAAVRIELWRHTFSEPTAQLRTEMLFAVRRQSDQPSDQEVQP